MVKRIELKIKAEESKEKAIADLSIDPQFNCASIIEAFQGNILGQEAINLNCLMSALDALNKKRGSAKKRHIQELLMMQAVTLQSIFTSLAIKASHQTSLPQYESFMRLALKSQHQSKSTLQTLMHAINPKQVAFIKQSNITSGPQQVNIHSSQATKSEIFNSTKPINELLDQGNYGRKKMDPRAKGKTKSLNTVLEALD